MCPPQVTQCSRGHPAQGIMSKILDRLWTPKSWSNQSSEGNICEEKSSAGPLCRGAIHGQIFLPKGEQKPFNNRRSYISLFLLRIVCWACVSVCACVSVFWCCFCYVSSSIFFWTRPFFFFFEQAWGTSGNDLYTIFKYWSNFKEEIKLILKETCGK